MKTSSIIIISSLISLTSGCSVLTKIDCKSTNLYQLGYNDGKNGNEIQNLDNKIKQCNSVEITLDAKKYQAGYSEGIHQYCSLANAYYLGLNGFTYKQVCPKKYQNKLNNEWTKGASFFCTEKNGYKIGIKGSEMPTSCPAIFNNLFEQGYEKGKDEFKIISAKIESLDNKISKLNSEINSKHEEIQRIKHEAEFKSISLKVTSKEDLKKIKNIKEKIKTLENKVLKFKNKRKNLKAQISK